MNWYYESEGRQQGPIDEAEFDRLIAAGTIKPETLVWRDGMADWKPLREARASAPGLVPPPVGMAPGSSGQCTSCGKLFPLGDLMEIQGQSICPNCKPAVLQTIQQGGRVPSLLDAHRDMPSWENRKQIGFFKALTRTVNEVLLQPGDTFSRMRRDGGLGTPIAFVSITGFIGMFFAMIYQAVLQVALPSLAGGASGLPPDAAAVYTTTVVGTSVVMVVLAPLIVIVSSFITAGLYHLMLSLFSGANQPFETTMRVVCYTSGAGMLLNIIPFCGGTVGGIWALVVAIIGLARAHETSGGKAAAAVLLPIILCCLVIGLAYGGIVAAMFSSGAFGNVPPSISE